VPEGEDEITINLVANFPDFTPSPLPFFGGNVPVPRSPISSSMSRFRARRIFGPATDQMGSSSMAITTVVQAACRTAAVLIRNAHRIQAVPRAISGSRTEPKTAD
jgi:hypothetical protein